jgi:hypothetical protein
LVNGIDAPAKRAQWLHGGVSSWVVRQADQVDLVPLAKAAYQIERPDSVQRIGQFRSEKEDPHVPKRVGGAAVTSTADPR